MTISSTTSRNDYTGTGAVDTYSYTFKIFVDADLLVTTQDLNDTETTLALTTDYTVTGAGDDSGGTIVLVAGNLTSGHKITIRRNRAIKQTTDIRNQGDFFAETYEDALDSQIMIDQKQQDELDRSVKTPETVTSSDFDPELPAGIDGAISKAPITNVTGDAWAPVANWPSAGNISAAEGFAAAAALSAAAAAAAAGTLSPYGINNLGLATSVAASALTIELKGADGTTDPSTGTDAVIIYFRDATITSGAMTGRTAIAALSVVIPSGATLGHNDNVEEFIYVYALDNASTIELAVSSSNVWDEGDLVTTVALTTGSDDAATMYSTSARTNVACRLIGRLRITETTAGTWDADATSVDVGFLFDPEDKVQARSAAFEAKNGRIYNVDTTGGTINIQLPDVTKGLTNFTVKDIAGTFDTNAATLVRSASENIEGTGANYTLDIERGAYRVFSDLTDWHILFDLPRQTNLDSNSHSLQFTLTGGQWGSASSKTLDIAAQGAKIGTYVDSVNTTTNEFTFTKIGNYMLLLMISGLATGAGGGGTVTHTINSVTEVFQSNSDTRNIFAAIPFNIGDTGVDYAITTANVTTTWTGGLGNGTIFWMGL